MKTTVICGLLGSGKTTCIQHVFQSIQEKAVVLVNDFGKAGIDGEIFSARGIESIELPSGCVCCTLKFDLATTIQRVMKDFSPEHLLIEPSGVASPSRVLEVLDILGVRPVTVVGIVDATEFFELHESQMYGSFFEDQIVNSDIILVNKTDLVDEEKVKVTLSLVERINPRAVVFPTVNASLTLPLPTGFRAQPLIRNFETHIHHDTLTMRPGNGERLLFYQKLFQDMAKGIYGHVVRAKGLVQTDEGAFRFDLSPGGVDCIAFEKPVADSRVVVIGKDLKRDAFPLQPHE